MKPVLYNKTRDKIYRFIRNFFQERDYAPTVRDILKGCNISSTAVVQYHLDVLQREGKIQRDPEVFRSIRLTGETDQKYNLETVRVPLLGLIAAGQPIPVPTAETWFNQELDSITLPPGMFRNQKMFALKVKGQSMIDALIDDGDIVLMEPVQTAVSGEMVAVWLQENREVTLKRIYYEGSNVRLQPANQNMKPMIHPSADVQIQGRVIGIIRKL